MPRLLAELKRAAPLVEIVVTRAGDSTEEDLRSGRIDLYLGNWATIPAAMKHHLLRYETFACIVRQGHPKVRARLSLETYMSLGHVLVTSSDRPGRIIDARLSELEFGRRVMLRTPHYLIAPLVVARTDLIATVPRSVAEVFAEILPLKILTPPLDAPGFPISMVWHPRTHEQPPYRWLRQVIKDLSSDATPL